MLQSRGIFAGASPAFYELDCSVPRWPLTLSTSSRSLMRLLFISDIFSVIDSMDFAFLLANVECDHTS